MLKTHSHLLYPSMNEEDNKSIKALSSSPYLHDKKQVTASPYRSGIKDKNFVNPSLISHDVFYNLDYPMADKNIPYCRKRQTVTEKVNNNPHILRSLTPEPTKNCMTINENAQKSYNTSIRNTPINQNIMKNKGPNWFENNQNPNQNYKSQKISHLEEFRPNNDNLDYGHREDLNPERFEKNPQNEEKIAEKHRPNQEGYQCSHGCTHNHNKTPTNNEIPTKINPPPFRNEPNDRRKTPTYQPNIQNGLENEPINRINPPNAPYYQPNIQKEPINKINPTNYQSNIQNDNNIGINNQAIDPEIIKPQENNDCDQRSEKSNNTMTSFTRNKDNFICDYCINQDLIDRKKEEKLLDSQRNRQIKDLNENFYQGLLMDNVMRQTERKKQLKDNREAQLQTIESKKNQYMSQRNLAVNYEREMNRLQDEENRLMKQRETEMEKAKREILRKDLENQMNTKKKEKIDYLSERNSGKDVALNIDNHYHNPYLPNKSQYIEEIEQQKAVNKEKSNREKEVKLVFFEEN